MTYQIVPELVCSYKIALSPYMAPSVEKSAGPRNAFS